MTGYLITKQASRVSGCSEQKISQLVQREIIKPAYVGKQGSPHQFKLRQVLALSVGQVEKMYGIVGPPVDNTIKMICEMDSGSWDRIMESRPILCVLPGTGVVAEFVPREFVQAKAAEFLATLGVTPIGIDLDLMDRRMRECIAKNEANGWKEVPESEEVEATK